MRNTIYIMLIVSAIVLSVDGEAYARDGIETHVGANTAVFAPWHHRTIAYGYGLSVVMRPSYARYMYDELESLNLGLTIFSTSQYVSEGFTFRDTGLALRYYFNRGEFDIGWESAFIGAGIGIATVRWTTEEDSGYQNGTDYLLEAGYEFDLGNRLDLPLVVMFHLNMRIIDIEPVSYTGMGASIGICYGISQ